MNRQKILVLTAVIVAVFLSAGCSSHQKKVVDRDGNSYNTAQIGSMVWTGKNLDVAHYRNGDPIPEIKNPKEWAILTTGAWCYNLNNPDNGKTDGKLYNWYAVNTGKLAPTGWHVPTQLEWQQLLFYLEPDYDIQNCLAIHNELEKRGLITPGRAY